MRNEQSVTRKIREGDIRTFESVFRRYYAPLHAYAAGLTGRSEIAEEIVQELFYKWWKEREKIEIKQSLKGYLFRSVRNLSLQHIEHRQVRDKHREQIIRHTGHPDPTPQEEMEYRELEQAIGDVLKKLPERRVRIFEMFRMEGMSYREIAEKYTLSVKTIEAEMSKTYKSLRKEIDKYYSK